jgi:CubicO group peptidase (beta-lactamase class C family)
MSSAGGHGRTDVETLAPPRRFAPVRDLLQRQVDDGRLPGFVAAVRYRGSTEVLTGGRRHLDADVPMTPDTQFRLASLSKPFAGVLALQLVEDGVVSLDAPVGEWLPEFAEPRVLRRIDGPVEDTVPAGRPITVRHLLASTPGFGGIWEPCPLADALWATGGGPGPFPPSVGPEEFLRRLAALPLAAQPGERWLYHVSTDVLSVLLARASGRSLPDLLAERITGPLGLAGTGFTGDPARLATQYEPADGGLAVLDPPDGRFARPPEFPGLAAGLVSTAPDVLAFLGCLADGGGPLLSAGSVAELTTDSLTAEQRAPSADFLGRGLSWGLQVGVYTDAAQPWVAPGRWGWDGGTGTSGWADPEKGVEGVLLTQRLFGGPDDGFDDFWQAVDDCL